MILLFISFDVEVYGEFNEYDVSVLKFVVLKGVFINIVSEIVLYVNVLFFVE